MALALRFEKSYPALFGAACAACSTLLSPAGRVQTVLDVAPQVLVVLAITVGFTATALAILLTAQDLQAIRALRTSSRQFNALVGYHRSAAVLGLVAAVWSIAMLVLSRALAPADIQGRPGLLMMIGWWLLSGWALMAFYRSLHLLTKLLVARPDPPTPT